MDQIIHDVRSSVSVKMLAVCREKPTRIPLRGFLQGSLLSEPLLPQHKHISQEQICYREYQTNTEQ